MEGKTPGRMWQDIAAQLTGLLSAIDADSLEADARKAVRLLKQLMGDARLDVRDYEFAESMAELTKATKVAVKRLEKLRVTILQASEHNIIGAVDVAQLTARIDQLAEQL